MSWTSEHDIYLCREVILMEPFKYKPSTRERGLAWESIAQDLNAITGDITFNVNKRSVRDRYNLLVEHFKMKQREYAKASGIEVEETELDQLLLELTEKADEAKQVYDKLTAKKNVHAEAEKSAAKDRQQWNPWEKQKNENKVMMNQPQESPGIQVLILYLTYEKDQIKN